ncbi:MAG: MATE family efflux transporter [Oscillospiraceae bacterium]|nr:MATE family efflux transporter [Oscillospiraceae bacterium]
MRKLFAVDKSFFRLLFTISIPISLQGLITFVVQLIDTMMLGHFGETTISAAALATSFFTITHCTCLGLSNGCVVITSQYWGKRELGPIRAMTSICLKIAVALMAFYAVVTYFFPAQIMALYTSDPDVIAEGVKYLRILAFTFILDGITVSSTAILRSFGNVRVALISGIIACLVNCFCNWVFIFGKIGAPAMYISGAALGTLIARICEFAIVFGYLIFRDKVISFRLHHLRGFNREIFRKYLKVGLPVLFSDLLMIIGANLITVIIGHTGRMFTAANSIASQIGNIIFTLFMGISAAGAVIIGNSIGEGSYRKAYDQGKALIGVCVIFSLIGGLILYLVRIPIIDIFKVTDTTKVYAAQIITVIAAMLVVQLGDNLLTKGILRGGGDTRFLIVGDTVFTYFVSVPLGYLAAFKWGFPIWLTYFMLRTDMICKFILCIWRFVSKKWIRDTTKSEIKQETI